MSAELLKELRKTSTAGLRQDYWQMNRDTEGHTDKGTYQQMDNRRVGHTNI